MRRASDDEGNFEYNRRTNRKILELFAKYSIDPIYIKVFEDDLHLGKNMVDIQIRSWHETSL